MERKNKAIKLFRGDNNCAQSVLIAFSDITGLNDSAAAKIAAGFGGGIGKMQEVCGALSGAVMVIGYKYYDEKNPTESKNFINKQIQTLLKKFESVYGSIRCRDLTELDFSTEEGMKKKHEENISGVKCEKYIADVCDLLEKLVVGR
ncbi:MAG: C_GCAxxG_C_C family protein [Ignavibacteria bacterium]|nr:C_GCAxxG_C_C family protein [Ignavibacteria bacterium]